MPPAESRLAVPVSSSDSSSSKAHFQSVYQDLVSFLTRRTGIADQQRGGHLRRSAAGDGFDRMPAVTATQGSPRSWRVRTGLVLFHRWAGLVLAGFLLVAGLTGSLLAFHDELEAALSPSLWRVEPPAPQAEPLDPLSVRTRVQAAYPHARVRMAPLHAEAGRALVYSLEAQTDADQVFVNPYTGEILGDRLWGDITQGHKNLVPFIYRLHYSLALGTPGSYVLGVLALLWTLDCLVGAILTFPPRPAGRSSGSSKRWPVRWWAAWKIRWGGGSYRLNVDLHRAGGLWTWAMLFTIAWSSVAFNLSEVYSPVMKAVFAHQVEAESGHGPAQPNPTPALDWHAARETGRRLMSAQAQAHGVALFQEELLLHDPQRNVYRYLVKSSRDIRDRIGSTSITFDADTGVLRAEWLPTGAARGDTIRTWITSLHMAAVWGLPMKLFVCTMGLVVGMLSITGVVIWARKRDARRGPRSRS